jgi:hypothetical protein
MNGTLLTGASGTSYFFTPYPYAGPGGGVRWHADPANYAFGWADESGAWQLAYIGETENLRSRLHRHSQWPAAQRRGCTHVLVNLNAAGQAARREQERDLIAAYQPPLNSQFLKPGRQRVRRMGYYPQGW